MRRWVLGWAGEHVRGAGASLAGSRAQAGLHGRGLPRGASTACGSRPPSLHARLLGCPFASAGCMPSACCQPLGAGPMALPRVVPASCPCPQVGLVTFGTHVHVHELGFADCPKAYVFRGSKDYSPAQVGRRGSPAACWLASGATGIPAARLGPRLSRVHPAGLGPRPRLRRSRSSWGCTRRRRSGAVPAARARHTRRARQARGRATASSFRCPSASLR